MDRKSDRGKGIGLSFDTYTIDNEPFYLPVRDEIQLFRAAAKSKLPVLLKGPTGCGKTRFIEYMAYSLDKMTAFNENEGKASDSSPDQTRKRPLITVACHEDMTATDLVGRYLLKGEETVWIDGPLTKAVRVGGICYLDEIVEARKDTTVLIHPLADYRRILPIEKRGEIIEAHEEFLLVISYNPGYQSVLKDLKHSTRQRFVAIEFDYPSRDLEARIIAHESGVDEETAYDLAKIGEKVRNLRNHGLQEGVSTRLLIYTGNLIVNGIEKKRACRAAITMSITDDRELQRAIEEVISTILE
jgi:nitric oxide reductase NorQ protein